MSVRRIIKDLSLLLGASVAYNKKSKILYYHDVYNGDRYTDMGTPLPIFKSHIDTIRKHGFEIVPHIDNPGKQVSIMFDDGFRGIYDCRHFFYVEGIRPTVFLAVSLLGTPGYLTVDEVKELQGLGFSFQSHGWEHTGLAFLNDDDLRKELVNAKHYLEEILGERVSEICLPIGFFSNRLLDRIKGEAYKEVYSSIPGNYDDLVMGMRRRNLVQYSSPFEVSLILHGGLNLFSKRYLRMHQVNDFN